MRKGRGKNPRLILKEVSRGIIIKFMMTCWEEVSVGGFNTCASLFEFFSLCVSLPFVVLRNSVTMT